MAGWAQLDAERQAQEHTDLLAEAERMTALAASLRERACAQDGQSYYTPERIDRILRDWPRYLSAAEGFRSSGPDALRPVRGKRGDALASADVIADLERALVAVIPYHSVAWRVLVFVMAGHSLTAIAGASQLGKQHVCDCYALAVERLARYLGWSADDEDQD